MIDDSKLPLRHVIRSAHAELDGSCWPATVPAVKQLLDDGLDLGPLTVFVGENGSGKSTLVEGLALAYGMSPEGGSTGARNSTRPSESALWRALTLRRGIGASRWGFFLRAETMHGYYSYLEDNPSRNGEPHFHEMSHGESFLAVLQSRFGDPGLYLLDEPESALSFTGCLSLVGARIYEVGEWGLRECPWAELDLVRDWSLFLDDPQRLLRHL